MTMPEAKAGARAGMPWTGVLRREELDLLADVFGDLIVAPGLTSKYGVAADASGRLYIPGASQGFKESRRVFRGWEERAQLAKYSWWPTAIEENGCETIRVRDILNGVRDKPWQAYTREYKWCVRHKKADIQQRRQHALETAPGELTEDLEASTLSSTSSPEESGVVKKENQPDARKEVLVHATEASGLESFIHDDPPPPPAAADELDDKTRAEALAAVESLIASLKAKAARS